MTLPRLCFILSWLLVETSYAELIYSVHSGQWHHPATWSSNSVPLTTDSVIIDHYVIFSDSITIDAAGNLLIDSCGTLCGNNCLNGHFTNYGHMYIGCFNITGPSYNYDTIISNNTSGSGVFNGGFLISYNYVLVGPNMPPCVIPPNQRAASTCSRVLTELDETTAYSILSVYPNPASDEIIISSVTESASPVNILLYDLTGKCIRTIQKANVISYSIKVDDLAPGYYIVKLVDEHFNSASGSFIIAR